MAGGWAALRICQNEEMGMDIAADAEGRAWLIRSGSGGERESFAIDEDEDVPTGVEFR